MYGYVYLTENLINGHCYIGKRKSIDTNDGYLGSGTLLRRAVKKYGVGNFQKTILAIAFSRSELSTLEIEYITKYNAINDPDFYNIAAGGEGGHTIAGYTDAELKVLSDKARKRWEDLSDNEKTAFSQKIRKRWEDMSDDDKTAFSQKMRDVHLGRSKSPEHCAKISKAKAGISHWTPEAIASMVEKRKAQIAVGIGVPPLGNRGNKDFRHTEESRKSIKAGVAAARQRIFSERETYHTEQGKISMLEKLEEYYTPEVRQQHGELIKIGKTRRQEALAEQGIVLEKLQWYHDPLEPARKGQFRIPEQIPEGWVKGLGPRKRKIDVDHVRDLISRGKRDADIAREIGCAPSAIWAIRHT